MKLDRLPPRITGFFDKAEPPHAIDGGAFKKACHLVAQMAGGSVDGIDLELLGRSYYGATLVAFGDRVSVLCNSVYPYVAFVPPGSFGLSASDLTFVDAPEVAALFTGSTEFQPLNSQWLASEPSPELLADLAPTEREQLKDWKPARVGDVIYNNWD